MAEIITPKQFTRRDLLRLASIGIVGAAVAPAKSASSGTRGLLAARGMAMSKRGGSWVNPYVTDGLLAMWDGDWNAGGGVHDAGATTWVDIVGGIELTPTVLSNGSYTWRDKSCIIVNTRWRTSATIGLDVTHEFTIEAVIKNPNVNRYMVGIGTNYNSTGIYAMYQTSSYWCKFGVRYAEINIIADKIGIVCLTLQGNGDGTFTGNNNIKRSSITKSDGTAAVQSACPYIGPYYDSVFSGDVCSARYYNTRLTDDQVAANYAVDCARFGIT